MKAEHVICEILRIIPVFGGVALSAAGFNLSYCASRPYHLRQSAFICGCCLCLLSGLFRSCLIVFGLSVWPVRGEIDVSGLAGRHLGGKLSGVGADGEAVAAHARRDDQTLELSRTTD